VNGVLFIGVGRMGAPMALRLADAGVALSVADLSASALEPFRARGIATAETGVGLAGDVVITMLPSDVEVRAALLGADGACTTLPRRTVIDMSSAAPAATVALAAELAGRDIALLDAPVSGGMAGAQDGSLTCMVGGDPALFARHVPLLEMMCRQVFHVGPVGSGHVVKALNNYLSAASLWSAAEALVIGSRLGLDPAAMLAVWNAGSGRSHATEVKLPRHVLTRRFDFNQSLELFCKDIAIAGALADQANIDAPGLLAILATWRRAAATLGGQHDITEIVELLERTRAP
jgi:3-hydroxyisobutyrate dehydrogenase